MPSFTLLIIFLKEPAFRGKEYENPMTIQLSLMAYPCKKTSEKISPVFLHVINIKLYIIQTQQLIY